MATTETTLLLKMKADLAAYNRDVLAAAKNTKDFQKIALTAFTRIEKKTGTFQTRTSSSFKKVNADTKKFEKITVDSFGKAEDAAKKYKVSAESAFGGIRISAQGGADSLFKFSNVAKAVISALAAGQFVEFADDIQKANNQLKSVTKTTEEYIEVQSKLNQIANETRQSVTELTSVYARFSRAGKEAGFTQQETLDLTESLTKAFKIEGNTTAEVNSTLLQLTQSFRSGRIQGEEFRAVSESSTIVLEALAKQMGVTVGQLKQLAADGKLTARTLVDGLAASADKIDSEFSKLAPTFAEVGTAAGNAMVRGFQSSGINTYLDIIKKDLIDAFTPDVETDLVKKINDAQAEIKKLAAEGDGFFTDNSEAIETLEARVVSLTNKLVDLRVAADDANKKLSDKESTEKLKKEIETANKRIEAEHNYAEAVQAIRNDDRLSESERLTVLVGLNKAALDQKLIDEKEFQEKQAALASEFAQVAESNQNDTRLADEQAYQEAVAAIRGDERLSAEERFTAIVAANKAALDQKLIDEKEFIEAQAALVTERNEGGLEGSPNEERLAGEEAFNARMQELNQLRIDGMLELNDFELESIKNLFENKLITQEQYTDSVIALVKRESDAKDKAAKLSATRDKQQLSSARSAVGAAMTLSNTFLKDQKELNAGLIIADTAVNVVQSVKNAGGVPWGIPAGIAAASLGLAQLAANNAASKGGGGVSAPSGSASTPTANFEPETSQQQISITEEGEGTVSTRTERIVFASDGGSASEQYLAESLNEGVRRGSISVEGVV